jgi:hypothetical protein
VSPETVVRLTSPVTTDTGHKLRYGRGFWLAGDGPIVVLEGADHGVSFRSWHDPSTRRTATVVSNTSDGAWPVARRIGQEAFRLPTLPP